MLIKKNRETV